MASEYVIGIDLGTTNTCAAVYRDGRSHIVFNDQGNRITPSCVAFSDKGRVVGIRADFRTPETVFNTVTDIKRMMGRKFDDANLQKMKQHWPFKVVNMNSRPIVEVSLYGRKVRFAPEELSAMILSKMKANAKDVLGGVVNEAVITVPAYFDNAQRQATKDAGTIAGFAKVYILSEPTAGALAYALDPTDNKARNLLIFDLGGGTLDVSLLNVKNRRFFVRATSGNSTLGGEDFTTRLVDHFTKEFNKKNKVDIRSNPRAVYKLRKACEQAKCDLSQSDSAEISVDSIFDGIDFNSEISRDGFDALCKDLLASCLKCIQALLKDTNLSRHQVDDIILTGGSSRMKKIQTCISKLFGGKELRKSFSMEEAVARGAAKYANYIKGRETRSKGGLVADVTPFSLGIEVLDERIEMVVPKNIEIPVVISKEFTTVDDNQQSVVCSIYEGDHISIKKNRFLGSFELQNIENAKEGVPVLDVTFHINEDGILVVSEEDTKTKTSNQIKINDLRNLKPEQVEEMTQVCQHLASMDIVSGPKVLSYLKRADVMNHIIKVRGAPWGTIAMQMDH